MELITIFLASLIGIVGSVGVIAENQLEKTIRDRVAGVDKLAVRIDNLPPHQVLRGSIDKLSVASRGLVIIPDVRIATIEIETDGIRLANFSPGGDLIRRRTLEQPIQLGLRLVLTEGDLNQALQSPQVRSYLEELIPQNKNYQLVDAQVNLLEDNKIELNIKLYSPAKKKDMTIIVNFGVKINQGTKLEIIEPIATINERKVSQRFLDRYILTLVDQLDLNRLEADGIITRVLQFQVGDEEINLASFISLEQLPVIARSAR